MMLDSVPTTHKASNRDGQLRFAQWNQARNRKEHAVTYGAGAGIACQRRRRSARGGNPKYVSCGRKPSAVTGARSKIFRTGSRSGPHDLTWSSAKVALGPRTAPKLKNSRHGRSYTSIFHHPVRATIYAGTRESRDEFRSRKTVMPRSSSSSRITSSFWRRSIHGEIALRKRDLISRRPPVQLSNGAHGASWVVGCP
jgi:hypothetical protein